MAIIHKATLDPSKPELINAFVDRSLELRTLVAGQLTPVGAYRFDDPAGDVGIETHLLVDEHGQVIQLPLTYRAAPLDGAEDSLLGTLEHSVLGTRWTYLAFCEQVYVTELVRTIVSARTGVDELVETPDGPVAREPSAHVKGSGADVSLQSTGELAVSEMAPMVTISMEALSIDVHLLIGLDRPTESPHLAGTWANQTTPVVLAEIR